MHVVDRTQRATPQTTSYYILHIKIVNYVLKILNYSERTLKE